MLPRVPGLPESPPVTDAERVCASSAAVLCVKCCVLMSSQDTADCRAHGVQGTVGRAASAFKLSGPRTLPRGRG
eukprot:gene9315-biopygen3981